MYHAIFLPGAQEEETGSAEDKEEPMEVQAHSQPSFNEQSPTFVSN